MTTPVASLSGVPVAVINRVQPQWTRLEPGNEVQTVEEGIQTRVRDPLFMISQQLRTGEFRARSAGTATRCELSVSKTRLETVTPLAASAPPVNFDIQQPLESVVENEVASAAGFSAPNWDSSRLTYGFRLSGSGTRLVSKRYDGDRLDWLDFDLEQAGSWTTQQHVAVRPQPAKFAGAPLSRWWSFEDGAVDLGGISRPQLEFLTPILIEFAILHGTDWLTFPLRHEAGQIRRIDRLAVFDSFNVVADASPVVDGTAVNAGWEVFTLTSIAGENDGRLFFMPNTIFDGLQSEPVEQVSATRDESANLYWLIENRYETPDGVSINRRDEESANRPDPAVPSRYWDVNAQRLVGADDVAGDGEPGRRFVGPIALYEPRTFVVPNRIPYRSYHQNLLGQHVLRRSRTVIDPTVIQYRGRFAAESKFLFEEEIPRIGLRLTRLYQTARDSAGRFYSWRSRRTEADESQPSSGLAFDALIESTGVAAP